ncbi:hypothetical protein BHM03_00010855 [Ensete ventricosum]|nr:hypothetical protein BHM03_00010855 [Ensete ventricosum]
MEERPLRLPTRSRSTCRRHRRRLCSGIRRPGRRLRRDDHGAVTLPDAGGCRRQKEPVAADTKTGARTKPSSNLIWFVHRWCIGAVRCTVTHSPSDVYTPTLGPQILRTGSSKTVETIVSPTRISKHLIQSLPSPVQSPRESCRGKGARNDRKIDGNRLLGRRDRPRGSDGPPVEAGCTIPPSPLAVGGTHRAIRCSKLTLFPRLIKTQPGRRT